MCKPLPVGCERRHALQTCSITSGGRSVRLPLVAVHCGFLLCSAHGVVRRAWGWLAVGPVLPSRSGFPAALASITHIHQVLGAFQSVCCGPHRAPCGGGLVTERKLGIHTQPSLVRSLAAGLLADPRCERRKHGHPSEARTEKPDVFAKFASRHESPCLFAPLNGHSHCRLPLSRNLCIVQLCLPPLAYQRSRGRVFVMPVPPSCGLEAVIPSFVSSSSSLLCFCSSRVHET